MVLAIHYTGRFQPLSRIILFVCRTVAYESRQTVAYRSARTTTFITSQVIVLDRTQQLDFPKSTCVHAHIVRTASVQTQHCITNGVLNTATNTSVSNYSVYTDTTTITYVGGIPFVTSFVIERNVITTIFSFYEHSKMS